MANFRVGMHCVCVCAVFILFLGEKEREILIFTSRAVSELLKCKSRVGGGVHSSKVSSERVLRNVWFKERRM